MLVAGLLQKAAVLDRKITQKQRCYVSIIVVRFEVLTAVQFKVKVIWDVALCSLVNRY